MYLLSHTVSINHFLSCVFGICVNNVEIFYIHTFSRSSSGPTSHYLKGVGRNSQLRDGEVAEKDKSTGVTPDELE